ncbi:MAG: AAA family ATPase, partial [Lentisphaerota bacterium]
MRINSIHLHNYKCHRNLQLTFGLGVTGIVGDNGSGKSSVISAIRFLFTGEVDTTKDAAINTNETEGWVAGEFTLNGIQGTLERHLSASKVLLRYDGVLYNKAIEVKELWSKLLKIDSTIFNNVIVASQGEIPLLFNGDTSVREKIFQKIFMVPPTERLRNIIWDSYIKLCPPAKFEEDIKQLQAQQISVATNRNILLAAIDVKLSCTLSELDNTCILSRITFLNRCAVDLGLRPALEETINRLQKEEEQLVQCINTTKERLAEVDFPVLKQQYDQLISQKKLASYKQELEQELQVQVSKLVVDQELAAKKQEIVEAEQAEQTSKQLLDDANITLRNINKQIKELDELDGHTNCPLCKQPITDIVNTLESYKQTADNTQRATTIFNAEYIVSSKKATRLRNEQALINTQYQQVKNLRQQLSRYSAVTYSEETLVIISKAVNNYETSKTILQQQQQKHTVVSCDLTIAKEKFNNLAKYDSSMPMQVELDTLKQAMVENKNILNDIESLRIEEAKFEHELILLEERIATAFKNQEYNKKRRGYLNDLTTAYEILHVSQFPRRLIQSYAEFVQRYLVSYLEQFNIPYRARIVEGFRIQMVNSEGKVVPEISGGQQMIVGICLRLALHRMFAQSFPLWIVDEGTTHLDENNRNAYFQLIENIRAAKIVDQAIVVDHDSKLSSVVDN